MKKEHPVITSLRESLPAVFTREEAAKQLGGLLSAKTLANYDAQGIGPYVKQRIGKKVVYDRSTFLAWLDHASTNVTISNINFRWCMVCLGISLSVTIHHFWSLHETTN